MRKRVERRTTRAFNQAMIQSPTATAIEVVRTAQVIAQQENDSEDEELSDESDFGFDFVQFDCAVTETGSQVVRYFL